MIKARNEGLLLLGVERGNIQHWEAGHPMVITEAEVRNGHPITEVVIFFGETFQDLVRIMKQSGAIPEDMVVPDPPKPPPKGKRH